MLRGFPKQTLLKKSHSNTNKINSPLDYHRLLSYVFNPYKDKRWSVKVNLQKPLLRIKTKCIYNHANKTIIINSVLNSVSQAIQLFLILNYGSSLST